MVVKTKEKVKMSQLGIFIKLVSHKIPFEERNTYGLFATAISNEFNVDCSAEDIINFYELDRDMEDIRLIYKNANLD